MAWILVGLWSGLAGTLAEATEEERNWLEKRGLAFEALISGSRDASIARFIDENLSDELRQAWNREELVEHLRNMRSACAGAGGIEWQPLGEDGLSITFSGGVQHSTLRFRVDSLPPHKISWLEFEQADADASEAGDSKETVLEPFTWESLSVQLEAEAAAGFSGTVLIVRDGTVVLHRGYGLADRGRGIPNTDETLFAIGSAPIDFTRAAVLKLEDLGQIRRSDRLSRYLPDVPEDKQNITLDHLMEGRSGLHNFHHVPGEDADYDLTWIDRQTAIDRILHKDLLFAPGEGEAHSHSAWVLLAAIVEIVSGRSYGEFVREELFEPAGMTHTGLYEDARRFSPDEVAVGYGSSSVGDPNTPAEWGRTSWLVMGSGGMVSNPNDLYRWVQAMTSGRILSQAAQKKYGRPGVFAGGNDRGFLCLYTQGSSSMMFLCSNAHTTMRDKAAAVARDLVRLVGAL